MENEFKYTAQEFFFDDSFSDYPKKKKLKWYQRLKVWYLVHFNDWPVYRVTYSDGERTYPLHYAEAKGCAEVFNGKLWIDWDYAKKLML